MDDKLNAERLRALDEAATVGDLSTAERQAAEEIIECPICQGHGEVLAADYCNIDGKALGVQFYGIGSEFGAHEALWSYLRNAVPAILAMAEDNASMLRILAVFERHYKANNCDGREGNVSIPVSALRAAASFLAARRALAKENASA
jgi:hypothetical protein